MHGLDKPGVFTTVSFCLPNERLALRRIALAVDLWHEGLEGGIVPMRVILGTVVRIPGMKIIRGIEQGRHNGANCQIKVLCLGFVKPDGHLHGPPVRLDLECLFEHGLNGIGPELKDGNFADHEVDILEALAIARGRHELSRFLDGGGGVALIP